MDLKGYVRDIPDFPVEGILFRDITPLLAAPEAFKYAVDRLPHRLESRGFLFAAPVAYRLGAALVPARKEGRLPYRTTRVTYTLEYGQDSLEIHTDALAGGHRVLIVDDLLATGGTMAAAVRLVEQAGAEVAGIAVVIELSDLEGRARLRGYDIASLITY